LNIVDLNASVNSRSMLVDVEFAIACAKAEGGGLIKFLHDDETTGAQIKKIVRAHLRNALKNGAVQIIVNGENYLPDDRTVRFLREFFPEIADDTDLGKNNRSITLVKI